ncbi:hypothetical protein B0J17DRAFT_716616 [Rhizoctonia solani]|nr:hypothetical protein B0J17DRAFT_716616 [Rhizoctonia solani]
MAPATRKNSGGKAQAAKAASATALLLSPSALVEAWYSAKVQGYPDKETIVGLAIHFERQVCVKQVNTFYTNRRQDVSNKVTEDGKITEDALHDLLWDKYKGTTEERQIAKQRGLRPAPSLTLSEGSITDSTTSEVSVESVCSANVPAVVSDASEWSAMITPAMAELLKVVNERMAEFEAGETIPL